MKAVCIKPRERILATATELFYQKGVHSVGIDEVIAKSGVAKMTLYKHFASKSRLIEEVMRQRNEEWTLWFFDAIEKRGGTPIERLIAIYDVLEEWFVTSEFNGCPFSMTAAQLVDTQHPAYKFCLEPKHAIYSYVLKLAQEANIRNPEELSEQFLVLIGGAIFIANLERSDASGATKYARQAASVLLSASQQIGNV